MTTTLPNPGVNPEEQTAGIQQDPPDIEQQLVTAAADAGLPVAELRAMCLKAGLDQFLIVGIPVHGAGNPKLPVYLHERTVRYLRECCAVVNVDPEEWVELWIGQAQVDTGLSGERDVDFCGICTELVTNYLHPDGTPFTLAEEEGFYEQFREIAFRYQQEVKEGSKPADTAMEVGGAK